MKQKLKYKIDHLFLSIEDLKSYRTKIVKKKKST